MDWKCESRTAQESLKELKETFEPFPAGCCIRRMKKGDASPGSCMRVPDRFWRHLSLKLSTIHARTAKLSRLPMREVEDCIAMVEKIFRRSPNHGIFIA